MKFTATFPSPARVAMPTSAMARLMTVPPMASTLNSRTRKSSCLFKNRSINCDNFSFTLHLRGMNAPPMPRGRLFFIFLLPYIKRILYGYIWKSYHIPVMNGMPFFVLVNVNPKCMFGGADINLDFLCRSFSGGSTYPATAGKIK